MKFTRREFFAIGGIAVGTISASPAAYFSMTATANSDFPTAASNTSSDKDFDFLIGTWSVKNRMLKSRLTGSNEWMEFDSTIETEKILNGRGNLETYRSSSNGKPFEGRAIRLFDADTRLWSAYWVDSNNPKMDQNPVIGSFENGVGKLYAKDTFNEKPVISLYQWDARDPKHPIWSQALSADNGKTWEWNWYMTLSRLKKL
jgi:hypothetical protein